MRSRHRGDESPSHLRAPPKRSPVRFLNGRTGLTIHRDLARVRLRQAVERLSSSTSGLAEPANDPDLDGHGRFTANHREHDAMARAMRKGALTADVPRRMADAVPETGWW